MQFKYTVHIANPHVPDASFSDVSGLAQEPQPARISKISGMNKFSNVTLKRGVISTPSLNSWLHDIQSESPRADRDIVVALWSDDHARITRRWRLRRARIAKHSPGPLMAKGGEVAMESIDLVCERIELY